MLQLQRVENIPEPCYPSWESRHGAPAAGNGSFIRNTLKTMTRPVLPLTLAAILAQLPAAGGWARACIIEESCAMDEAPRADVRAVRRLTVTEIEGLIANLDNAYRRQERMAEGITAMPMRTLTLTGAEAGSIIVAFLEKNGIATTKGAAVDSSLSVIESRDGRFAVEYVMQRGQPLSGNEREEAIAKIQGKGPARMAISREYANANNLQTKRAEVNGLLLELERLLEWVARNRVPHSR